MKLLRFAVLLLFVALTSTAARAQAVPTASREPFQVGFGWSFADPDYTQQYMKGFTWFGDYSITRRISVEGDYHDTALFTPDDLGETTVLVGPRYSVALEGRANVYVKTLGGIGRFEFQSGTYPNPHSETYGVFAGGGGIEFRAARHINIRAIDIEYQIWPGFPPHGLTPFVTTMGLAYTH